jgi:hypothetical protein
MLTAPEQEQVSLAPRQQALRQQQPKASAAQDLAGLSGRWFALLSLSLDHLAQNGQTSCRKKNGS